MKKYLFLGLLTLGSCKKSETSEVTQDNQETKSFEMYEMSEMALLMEQMYVDHMHLKNKIMEGEDLGSFPDYLSKLHSSVMTDETDRDAFFKEQSALFEAAHLAIYEANEQNRKEVYNAAVQACISCHEVKCSGPIPKIKKLYID